MNSPSVHLSFFFTNETLFAKSAHKSYIVKLAIGRSVLSGCILKDKSSRGTKTSSHLKRKTLLAARVSPEAPVTGPLLSPIKKELESVLRAGRHPSPFSVLFQLMILSPVTQRQPIQTISAVDKDDFANGQRFSFALPSQMPVNPNFTLKDNEGNWAALSPMFAFLLASNRRLLSGGRLMSAWHLEAVSANEAKSCRLLRPRRLEKWVIDKSK